MQKRGSGILLHITSLPSPYGAGDLGRGAYRFVDFLSDASQSYWQILPLNPTNTAYGNSPYSSFSAFAGNPFLISPEIMIEHGILSKSDIKPHPLFPKGKTHYKAATEYKDKILDTAYDKNKGKVEKGREFKKFCSENTYWLEDYSLFISIKKHFNDIKWSKWPVGLRDRRKDTIKQWKKRLSKMIMKEKFFQYIFFKQWYLLKKYCDSKNIQLIGDIPIYVNYDSADVWANPGMFLLDKSGRPEFVTGAPPDYFSLKGQLWGHPVYNWDVLKRFRYSWWVKRIEHNLGLFHMFRLDHFRGFVAYWRILATERIAKKGKWVKAPAEDFFKTLRKHSPYLPMIAEDLGMITSDVREIMNQFGFPGMKVLLFAFGKNLPDNPYAPHNHIKNCVVYTGTHDSNTIKGWYRKEIGPEDRKRLSEYIGKGVSLNTVHWDLIRLAMGSVAGMVIIPMQDFLGLPEGARMNSPARPKGNWCWRVTPEQLSLSLAKRISGITRIYGRTSC